MRLHLSGLSGGSVARENYETARWCELGRMRDCVMKINWKDKADEVHGCQPTKTPQVERKTYQLHFYIIITLTDQKYI